MLNVSSTQNNQKLIEIKRAPILAKEAKSLRDRPKDIKPTMVCTHVLNRGGKGVRSPVDAL